MIFFPSLKSFQAPSPPTYQTLSSVSKTNKNLVQQNQEHKIKPLPSNKQKPKPPKL